MGVPLSFPTVPGLPQAAAPPPTPRTTYFRLQRRGLTQDEAASLTAFMCGLPAADLRWSLGQVNQLLFLQALYQRGRFEGGQGEHPQPN
jgi:hypothetical protein